MIASHKILFALWKGCPTKIVARSYLLGKFKDQSKASKVTIRYLEAKEQLEKSVQDALS